MAPTSERALTATALSDRSGGDEPAPTTDRPGGDMPAVSGPALTTDASAGDMRAVGGRPTPAIGEPVGDAGFEDERTQQRRLAAVWLAAGSALAAMVAAGWYEVAVFGGVPPGGDMVGHDAAARWLRTLPWWDWRGWSDWFYGGQAIGVNYPPLGHAWMRFTHPAHGQMAAVAVGLLVLLPWGALRLARAVGYPPRRQRAAVGAVLVLAAASGNMHWVLSGFHYRSTFYGSWPAMVAIVLGLFSAAWAARCARPGWAGVVLGTAMLWNGTYVPGIVVVLAVLLATSGARVGQAVRWMATAGAAALAVCAWWLVPFLAGWARLVHWEVSLAAAWARGNVWQVAVLATVAVLAIWAARRDPGPSRRLSVAALGALGATVAAELGEYLRPERWLDFSILVAAMAAAGLVGARPGRDGPAPVRPAWTIVAVAGLLMFVVTTLRLEALPLAAWLMWRPGRSWAWSGALAWAAALIWVPFFAILAAAPSTDRPLAPLEAVAAQPTSDTGGLVFLDRSYNRPAGESTSCSAGYPWHTTEQTGGSIRPLFGLYRESSAAAEFLGADTWLRSEGHRGSGDPARPHWLDAWDEAGRPSMDNVARAQAVGARWYAECDSEGNVVVSDLAGVTASGVRIVPLVGEEGWHQAAVDWWMDSNPDTSKLPVMWTRAVDGVPYPFDQAASGVSLASGPDRLTINAQSAGWVWLRVPWDPDWRSAGATPVLKGGPGHLVVWAESGITDLHWSVPAAVDAAAAAVTSAAVAAAAGLAALNRRRGWDLDPTHRHIGADAFDAFADTVDGWARAATRSVRGARTRIWGRHRRRN